MRSAYDLSADAGVDWLLHAACREYDPEWWSVPNANNDLARKICRTCPVKQPCLARALRLGSIDMIVAGQTPNRLPQTHMSGKHRRVCARMPPTSAASTVRC